MIVLSDVEEGGLVGRSPPLPTGVSVTTAVDVELVVSRRAVTEVEVSDVAVLVVLLVDVLVVVVPVTMTVVVVPDVRPPPPGVSVVPPSPEDVVELVDTAAGNVLTAEGIAATLEFPAGGSLGGSLVAEGSADVTTTAKASTALIVGPAGRQFSIPGYCAL